MSDYSKIIHYCWFGPKPISNLTKKCINSWKKYLPDYEIKLWNENNFDFSKNRFALEAYKNQKWAFVSDYVRLKAIYEYGGIYLDTDMEIIKDITDIIEKEQCFLGIEDSGLVNAAVIGTKEPHNQFIGKMLEIYESFESFDSDDIYKITIPSQITKVLKQEGLLSNVDDVQKLYNGSVSVYAREYFYPLSYDYQDNVFTSNTCMIHHFDATWASKPEKAKLFFRRHNMKFMLRIVDICVSIKIRFKRIINRIRGIPNPKI